MNTNSTGTDKSDNRILALTAFILFLAGFFLPVLILLIIVFFRPYSGAISLIFVPLNFLACGGELLALVFGLMTWRQKLGKTAAMGAVLFWILFIINLIRFYHHSHPPDRVSSPGRISQSLLTSAATEI